MDEQVPGFVAPVHRALTEPILLGGAPRSVAIVNGTLAAALGLGLRLWLAGLLLWFIGHMAAGSRLGELKGHSGVKGAIELVRNAFDRFTETIEDIIIEGDKVVTRYVASGVHSGQYFDLPPTGTLVSVDEISIFRVRNRLVVEQWCLGQMRE